ncbi:MAG: DUF1080 domain-containing protein [Acidobacteria bacterium]|nr:DUF1080 domain-containing protein [Acidobacteriota bacterium]
MWIPLFNEKDLSGWRKYGNEKWIAQDGEILGEAVTKAYGYLGTEKIYKNFELKGKFKAEGTGNSGIFYHSTIEEVNINGVLSAVSGGRIRIAPTVFNTHEDIDKLLTALA